MATKRTSKKKVPSHSPAFREIMRMERDIDEGRSRIADVVRETVLGLGVEMPVSGLSEAEFKARLKLSLDALVSETSGDERNMAKSLALFVLRGATRLSSLYDL